MIVGPQRRDVPTLVRAGDIVMHEKPDPRRVRSLIAAYRRGDVVEPISIGHEMKDHWAIGPLGMVRTGYGHFLADGHHRLAAFLSVYGPDALIPALMRFPQTDINTEFAVPTL